MLVLSRNIGSSVIVGDGQDAVKVTVIDTNGYQVKLGFEAPRHIAVDREEIREAKEKDGIKSRK